jgi:ParB family chromosome partitioning protein
MRRYYAAPVALTDEDEARLAEASAEYDKLAEGYSSYDEMPEDVADQLTVLEAEIEKISEKRSIFDPQVIAHGGVFVVLNHDGVPRIERGFVRPEDEKLAQSELDCDNDGDTGGNTDPDDIGNDARDDTETDEVREEAEEPGKPISDSLIRDLTAHRTLTLRVALSERPDMALVAVVHTLTAQLFYSYTEAGCLEIRPTVTPLGSHAEGIEDTPLAATLAERHEAWAERMPRDVADLWAFIVTLDDTQLLVLLAHCASRTVNALRLPWDCKPKALQTAAIRASSPASMRSVLASVPVAWAKRLARSGLSLTQGRCHRWTPAR